MESEWLKVGGRMLQLGKLQSGRRKETTLPAERSPGPPPAALYLPSPEEGDEFGLRQH